MPSPLTNSLLRVHANATAKLFSVPGHTLFTDVSCTPQRRFFRRMRRHHFWSSGVLKQAKRRTTSFFAVLPVILRVARSFMMKSRKSSRNSSSLISWEGADELTGGILKRLT